MTEVFTAQSICQIACDPVINKATGVISSEPNDPAGDRVRRWDCAHGPTTGRRARSSLPRSRWNFTFVRARGESVPRS